MRLAETAGLTVFVCLFYTWTTLVGSAVLGVVLVGYVSWALGGWRWLLAPLILFVSYSLLSPRNAINSRRVHTIHAVIAVSAGGLLWLFLYRILDRPELFYPFTLAFACELAIIGVARIGFDPALLALCILQGWGLVFLPYLVLEWAQPLCLRCVLGALPAVALAACAFYALQPQVRNCPTNTPRWLRQAASGALGSVAGLVPLYLF
jgi:phytol kinase